MTSTANSAASALGGSVIDRLNAPGPSSSQSAMQRLDQGDFLRLLTTQLTLQDPLEPVNNEDMLAQMAQFSSLEAATASSSTLDDISAKLDDLIEAQHAVAEAATAAAQAASEAAAAANEAAQRTAPAPAPAPIP